MQKYGFESYEAPLIEPLQLYQHNQEMINDQTYNFKDRGGREVTIRPEMTPSLARMVVAKQKEMPQQLRWWSLPRVWRYEKPQKGRKREHWQLNVDLLGIDSAEAEVEILLIIADLFTEFKAGIDSYQIQISSRQLIEDLIIDYLNLDKSMVGSICQVIDSRSKISSDQFEIKLKQLELDDDQIRQLTEILNVEAIDQLPKELRSKKSVKTIR